MKARTRHLIPSLGLAATVVLVLPFTGCSSSNGKGDKTAPTVSASPADGPFATTVDVTLTATDAKDSDPDIYYTTDLSEPTTSSTLYTGPFTLSATTVVKFIAVDSKGNTSPVGLAGYSLATTPIAEQLAMSGHGHLTGEPFRHWDEDGEVPTSCARCHSDSGLADYGMDGTVDATAALPLGFQCSTCHDPVPSSLYENLAKYPALEFIEFPSGESASLFNSSNICMACHQGRESGLSVDDDIADVPGGPYSFINLHYYPAAATNLGVEVNGGYEYAGKEYVGRNVFPSHEESEQTCIGCHMQGTDFNHTFLPDIAVCQTCHTGTTYETLSGSPSTNYTAIQTTKEELLEEIQDYAKDVLGEPIAYANQYPYFFFDLNGNGEVDANEASSSNRYNLMDEALLKAAYNYQMVEKDPMGYIHNGTYHRQLIQDSVEDLGGAVSVPAPGRNGFDHDNASKSEQWHLSGHAASANEPWRHWDGDGEVPESCAKCHSTAGFADYVADGTVDAPAALGSLLECKACHIETNLYADSSTKYDDTLAFPALEPVLFPSGDTQTLGNAGNICMTCHQGRESGVSVEAPTPNSVVQSPDYDSYDFINRHYYAAAAIYFGTDVNAAYELPGQSYAGQNAFAGHGGGLGDCFECHTRGMADHRFEVELSECSLCHTGISDFEELGLPFGAVNVDYDGDGLGESFQGEIDGAKENLLEAIYAYADGSGLISLAAPSPIVYSGGGYPYWFKDLDADGVADPEEVNFGNRYRDFDIVLLRSAFNYHSAQDPCSDIHNYKYVLQTLYDAADFLDDATINGSAPGIRP